MTLADLPRKLLTRCFSYLSTDLLTDIILLENIPDNILEAAADNLNLWYANKLRDIEENELLKTTIKPVSTSTTIKFLTTGTTLKPSSIGLCAYTKFSKRSPSSDLFGSIIIGKAFSKCVGILMK